MTQSYRGLISSQPVANSILVFAGAGFFDFLGKGENKMASVKEILESNIKPITVDFSQVRFFDSDKRIVRSFLTVNSLELGVLGYAQYRFVARRTKVGNHLVRRHLQKLFRLMPRLVESHPEIECFTIPVYARLLAESELALMLVDMISLYPEIPMNKICVELSADILYEDLEAVSVKINELRELGVKVAICEIGDMFCPVFRLAEIKFDYAFMDCYSTASLDKDERERIAGSLVKYLHYLDIPVIAPGLDSQEKIAGAKSVGADGYTTDSVENEYAVGGDGE